MRQERWTSGLAGLLRCAVSAADHFTDATLARFLEMARSSRRAPFPDAATPPAQARQRLDPLRRELDRASACAEESAPSPLRTLLGGSAPPAGLSGPALRRQRNLAVATATAAHLPNAGTGATPAGFRVMGQDSAGCRDVAVSRVL